MITFYHSSVPFRPLNNFLPWATDPPPYSLACFALQLRLLHHDNLQKGTWETAMSICDQTRIYHLSRLSLGNINYNINKLSTKEEKTRVGFFMCEIQPKARHTGLFWNSDDLLTIDGKMIKNGPIKNPPSADRNTRHRMVSVLQSRNDGVPSV